MSRLTDASLARAFREMSRRTSIGQPWTLDYFVLMVNKSAERFDSEDGTFLQTEEVCDCGYVRGSLGCDDAHKKREELTTSPERVQIPAESEHVASCVAEVPLGYFDQLSKEIKTWPVLDESKFADFPSLLDGMDAPHTPPDGKVACPIPTCRAELIPGQTCGGANCGLRRTE